LKHLLLATALLAGHAAAEAREALTLGNDPWDPFIVEGQADGTAEALVTEALERAGWSARVETGEWAGVLERARAGELDGIAALWKTPEREADLLFSDAYLTNRMVPLVKRGNLIIVESLQDLSGLRVALAEDYAYGEDIEAMRPNMVVEAVAGADAALAAVRDGVADVAIVDELIARRFLDENNDLGLKYIDTVLAFRELHFAVTRNHPEAAAIVNGFNEAFDLMVRDGSLNRILGVEWLATDLGGDGTMDVVMHGGLDLTTLREPTDLGATYTLTQADYEALDDGQLDYGAVSWRVDGEEHADLSGAMGAKFGQEQVCSFDKWQTVVRCTPRALNR
jgi:polar amino acid transport system substrate-binding protein